MKDDAKTWAECMRIAGEVLVNGNYSEYNNGANHFVLNGCSPSWISSPRVSKVEGPKGSKHKFYSEK